MHNSKWLFFISIIGTFLLSSCATYPTQSYQQQSGPSFTNVTGWNRQSVYYNGAAGVQGTATGIDVDGQIGYPMTVWSPGANCINANGQVADWNMSPVITSGTLPPGLVMDPTTYKISGIPTARGHWIVELNSGTNLYCNGQSYAGFTQELRFHIKGSGSVNE